ncbi:GtrA family protein [Gammaproteobacteria bacterium]|nr:GtrA family protein [Gammaproteobacteria bacterium]
MIGNISIEETSKFIINGLVATLVHFLFLIAFTSHTPLNYGVSNFLAYLFGSTSSFLGNKFLVFRLSENSKTFSQLLKFIILYAFLAFNHGFALYFWTDVNGHNFIIGFLTITVINTIISFLINKFIIFRTAR